MVSVAERGERNEMNKRRWEAKMEGPSGHLGKTLRAPSGCVSSVAGLLLSVLLQ